MIRVSCFVLFFIVCFANNSFAQTTSHLRLHAHAADHTHKHIISPAGLVIAEDLTENSISWMLFGGSRWNIKNVDIEVLFGGLFVQQKVHPAIQCMFDVHEHFLKRTFMAESEWRMIFHDETHLQTFTFVDVHVLEDVMMVGFEFEAILLSTKKRIYFGPNIGFILQNADVIFSYHFSPEHTQQFWGRLQFHL